GIQDFEKLRTENFLYVDKTQFVYKLAQESRPYFLGRPRRFGKSLFLSTLKAYFLGKKELFDGLYIAGVEKEWAEYPVFHIEFVGEEYSSLDNFHAKLDLNLRNIENVWGRNKKDETFAGRFMGLIQRAYEKTGKKVVVLVDEYDKPLLESFNNPELNEKMRNTLKGFYGVLKGMDAYLRLVFLTGVTKFSKVSIFSDLNMLDDISMSNHFSGICGISEAELLENFQPEIRALAERLKLTCEDAFAKLKKNYDGYHFSEESEDIYNPFSLLNTFKEQKIAYYWFKTGTPTFLIKMLKNSNFNLPELEGNIWITENNVTDYRADNEDPIPVLYQSGYLTIKNYEEETNLYVLGFPNEEVKYGFLNELLPVYSYKPSSESGFSVIKMMQALKKGNIEDMMNMLTAYYASIPYDLIEKKNKNERYFQSLFYTLFSLIGQFVQTEVKSANGRSDAVVKTTDSIYVFEFKMDDQATAEQALKQIDDKSYLIPYTTDGRKLVKIGATFNRDEGLLKDWLLG
ncbi:MAG: ATP-binding protein, partial [Dysgonamonadaceae bacterium]|nr:ATP-binding protein [Dysgonamonadaceae bacterium]